MSAAELNVVTGAHGFSGRYIARKLLRQGKQILTLSRKKTDSRVEDGPIRTVPFDFENPAKLTRNMEGATTLYNTYWIRFEHGIETFDKAIAHSKILFQAAKEAGIRRIVHISITNPSLESPLPYFRGKALVEQALIESGLSYAILRPAVLFGDQGILINNMAWLLRRFPIFTIPGDGKYGLQPIHVEDLADLAVTWGAKDQSIIMDAIGPETYTFQRLLETIATAIGSRTEFIHVRPTIAYMLSKLPGYLIGDVVMTWDEVKGLMDNLLVSAQSPSGNTKLSEWLKQNADWIGVKYLSEIKMHFS